MTLTAVVLVVLTVVAAFAAGWFGRDVLFPDDDFEDWLDAVEEAEARRSFPTPRDNERWKRPVRPYAADWERFYRDRGTG